MSKDLFVHSLADVQGRIGEGTSVWPFATIRENAEIGCSCVVGRGAYIDEYVVVGANCKIENGVQLFRGVVVEDHVFLGPNCVFTNVLFPRSSYPVDPQSYLRTRVGLGASVGANATIVCGISLGSYCFIGAGATITQNIPSRAVVVGHNRIIQYTCDCGSCRVDVSERGRESPPICSRCGSGPCE